MGKNTYAYKNGRAPLERFTHTEKQETWVLGSLKDRMGDLPCTDCPFEVLNFVLCIHIPYRGKINKT